MLSLDTFSLLILLVITLAYTAVTVRWHSVPAEDALMLDVLYATNLAHGAGITWNPGDAPVEGATDFLYLVCVTLWMKVSGLDAIAAARTFSFAAHILCIVLMNVAGRRLFGGHPAIVAILALYLGTGPGVMNVSLTGLAARFMLLLRWPPGTSAVGLRSMVTTIPTGRRVSTGLP